MSKTMSRSSSDEPIHKKRKTLKDNSPSSSSSTPTSTTSLVDEKRAHIEAIFATRAKNDPNSITLANTLAKDIHTLFKGPNKYILELLQNADDAAKDGEVGDVEILFLTFVCMKYQAPQLPPQVMTNTHTYIHTCILSTLSPFISSTNS